MKPGTLRTQLDGSVCPSVLTWTGFFTDLISIRPPTLESICPVALVLDSALTWFLLRCFFILERHLLAVPCPAGDTLRDFLRDIGGLQEHGETASRRPRTHRTAPGPAVTHEGLGADTWTRAHTHQLIELRGTTTERQTERERETEGEDLPRPLRLFVSGASWSLVSSQDKLVNILRGSLLSVAFGTFEWDGGGHADEEGASPPGPSPFLSWDLHQQSDAAEDRQAAGGQTACLSIWKDSRNLAGPQMSSWQETDCGTRLHHMRQYQSRDFLRSLSRSSRLSWRERSGEGWRPPPTRQDGQSVQDGPGAARHAGVRS
ncbi:unnamed protein product [Pleuronectes platessa]|uniref:Uncharacterized protein n=1 Tax=Pleuronectes platessa TaxID=8262 RepID=A0A9N7U000_PLEPL|nr:unnamed protein product [Pleuronectes platessa]